MPFGQTLAGYCLLPVFGAGLTFVAFGVRPQGPFGPVFVRLVWLSLAALLFGTADAAYHEQYTVLWFPVDQLIVLYLSGVISAVLTLRWRRSQPPPPKAPFEWDQYLSSVGMLLLFFYAIARALGDSKPPFPTGGPHDWRAHALNTLTVFLGGFILSQLTTSAVITGLQKPLERDWLLAETSPHRRVYIFLLAGVPVALLILPSLMNSGAMLGGVLLQVAFLILLWRCTDWLPTSIVTFGRHLLARRLRTLVRRGSADPART
jgi:hypothetical protein